MKNVTGKLQIREGYVDIVNATMKKGDSSLVIDGRVMWRAGVAGANLLPGETRGQAVPVRPQLTVTARNVPIDKDLLAALPEDRRKWIEKIGLGGMIDIDGRVWREQSEQMQHEFDIS